MAPVTLERPNSSVYVTEPPPSLPRFDISSTREGQFTHTSDEGEHYARAKIRRAQAKGPRPGAHIYRPTSTTHCRARHTRRRDPTDRRRVAHRVPSAAGGHREAKRRAGGRRQTAQNGNQGVPSLITHPPRAGPGARGLRAPGFIKNRGFARPKGTVHLYHAKRRGFSHDEARPRPRGACRRAGAPAPTTRRTKARSANKATPTGAPCTRRLPEGYRRLPEGYPNIAEGPPLRRAKVHRETPEGFARGPGIAKGHEGRSAAGATGSHHRRANSTGAPSVPPGWTWTRRVPRGPEATPRVRKSPCSPY